MSKQTTPRKPIANAIPEQEIQRAVCQHLELRGAPGLVWFHPANGGYRRRVEASIFAGLGVRPGVSDLILLRDGCAFALELKTDDGRPAAAQTELLSDFCAAGGEASIAQGLDHQALGILETWGLLRGKASESDRWLSAQ